MKYDSPMAEYFSEYANEGEIVSTMEDGWGHFISIIAINPEDRLEFPELENPEAAYIYFIEDDQGFVDIEIWSEGEYIDYMGVA